MEESRLINKEQALQMQKDFDFDLFMETSAKTGMNAQELFVEAGKLLYINFFFLISLPFIFLNLYFFLTMNFFI